MSLKVFPSHVAVLVRSVKKAADFLKKFDFQIGQEEIFEGEGTKEIYVEYDNANSLLLMEPTRAGPYQRALEKRGPGIHHLAIDVLDIENFIHSLVGSGWLLHPSSLKTMKKSKTVYLARPGFPGLIEVQEREKITSRPLFVEGISLKTDAAHSGLLDSIGLGSIVTPSIQPTELILSGKRIPLSDFIS